MQPAVGGLATGWEVQPGARLGAESLCSDKVEELCQDEEQEERVGLC